MLMLLLFIKFALLPVINSVDHSNDNKPLFLTPYIRSGNIEKGRELAKVKPFVGNVASYSGFLTVNSTYNSNLFFWFFPQNTSSWQSYPLALWLQGGPGATSLFGLFEENGPYVFKNGKLRERYYSWTTEANLLYIDNPVGVGFSFTESENGYANNELDVAGNLYEAISQFYSLFPVLRNNRFFITGESYAGKYIPNLAAAIHRRQLLPRAKINLHGLFMGNPFIEPEQMLNYNDYLYWIGLLDENGRGVFEEREDQVKRLIKLNMWEDAAEKFAGIFFEGLGPTLFSNLTGLKQHYHFLLRKIPQIHFISFLQKSEIKKTIHVGSLEWNNGRKAYNHLKKDLLQSSRPVLEDLLEHYKVLIYAGQLDIICPFYLIDNVVQHLNWKYTHDYIAANRTIFHVDQYIAGYSKTVDKLTTVLIRNAGHMVPRDKPQWARVLLRRFVNDQHI